MKLANLELPTQIFEQGELPQWRGSVRDKTTVEIYYDDDISGVSSTNKYAVFSEAGFHGWLSFGFVYREIEIIVQKEVIDYQKAYDDFEDEAYDDFED